jgi:hypothetical protein
MVIRISIDTRNPLAGSAATDGRDPLPFEGWMELLRVIAELVGTPPDSEGGVRPFPKGPGSEPGIPERSSASRRRP